MGRTFPKLGAGLVVSILAGFSLTSGATDGVWTNNASSSWSTAINWLGGTIGDGAGATVYFTNNITAGRTITLDTSRSVGFLQIGDANVTHSFTLSSATTTLTLDSGTVGVAAQINQTATSKGDTISVSALTLNSNLQVGNASTNNLTISGGVGESGGSRSITKTGSGGLTLSGTSSYSGGVFVNEGTLNISKATSAGSGTITIGDSATGANAGLDLSGSSYTATNPIVVAAGSGSRTISSSSGSSFVLSGGVVLSNDVSVSSTSSGTINLSGAISGPHSVTINSGSATVLLSSSGNSYSGGTILSGGTLKLNANNVLPDSGVFTFAGGTLILNKKTDYAGSLSLLGNAVITLTTGSGGLLSFNGGSYTAGQLTINGWTGPAFGSGTGDQLFFRDNSNTAVSAPSDLLSHISFSGFNSGATELASGEIVPIPEPIVAALGIGAGMAAAGLILLRIKNWIQCGQKKARLYGRAEKRKPVLG